MATPYKKLIILIVVVAAQFVFLQSAVAAGGSVTWSQSVAGVVPRAIAVGGSFVYTASNDTWSQVVKRNNTTGAVIWSVTTTGLGATSIAVDGTGVYVAGAVNASGTYNYGWVIEKRSLVDGSLIWSRTIHPSGTGYDVAMDIVLDATGAYVAGVDQSLNPAAANGYQWRIEKLNLSTGASIWAQTANGTYGYSDSVRKVRVDGTGVYILGTTAPGGTSVVRLEKRNLSTGALIWGQNTPWTNTADPYRALAVDSTGVYAGGAAAIETGVEFDPIQGAWVMTYAHVPQIEKRNLTTGAVLWVIADPLITGYNATVNALFADASGLYVASHRNSIPPDPNMANAFMRIQKRNTSGTVVWSLEGPDTGSPGNAYIYDLTADATSLYDAGYDFNNYPGAFVGVTEKRDKLGACTGTVSVSWTDPVITANSTKIRATHIGELRTWIDNRRIDAGLAGYVWTDPALTANSTKIRKVHFDEMRTAIGQVYAACGQAAPTWTDPALTANSTKIRAVHVNELRSAVTNAQ